MDLYSSGMIPLTTTSFQIRHIHYDKYNYFETKTGNKDSCFGFLLKGKIILQTAVEQFTIPENGLFFLPMGAIFCTTKYGFPDIELYNLQVSTDSLNTATGLDKFTVQYITELSNEPSRDLLTELCLQTTAAYPQKQYMAISLVYRFLAEVIPYMKTAQNKPQHHAITSAIYYTKLNFYRDYTVEELASYCYLSPSRLFALFSSELKTTPIGFRNTVRIQKAADELKNTARTIDDIAEACGFHSTIYFRETFKAVTGLTPTGYRKKIIADTCNQI